MIKFLGRTSPLFAVVVALTALAGANAPAQTAKAASCNQAWDCHGICP